MNELKNIDLNDIFEDLFDRIAKVFFDFNHSYLNCEVIHEENNYFLSAPFFHLVVGLIFYFILCLCVGSYDSFDRFSAGYGALMAVALEIYVSGLYGVFIRFRSRKSFDRGSEGDN